MLIALSAVIRPRRAAAKAGCIQSMASTVPIARLLSAPPPGQACDFVPAPRLGAATIQDIARSLNSASEFRARGCGWGRAS